MSAQPKIRSAPDGAKKSCRFSTKVTHISLLTDLIGFRAHGDHKKILMDLIEEDFTGKNFDNVKAIHSLVKVVEEEHSRGVGQYQPEEAFVVKIMCWFFKYRNRPEQLQVSPSGA